MLNKDFSQALRNPPKSYRPIPFWSWNEKLAVDETRRQIAAMDRAGLGGYFMHARGGLQTPYLGEEWMANIGAGVDEARRRGMGAWAYDENGWPSGFGDGRINGKGLRWQQKYLRWEAVATAMTRDDGRTITHVPLPDGRLLHFYFDVNPFYVDTLDAAVTADFLSEIYAPYAARFGEDLGAAMPGFFTDEPQVSRNGIPWSFALPDAYRRSYDEELLPLLPGLFLEEGPWRRTRYRFWHLVQELFATAFMEQIYRWCSSHGCQLTGHMVLEETLLSQLTSNGAAMPHYEFYHVPGMDWLGRHIDPPTTPLQVASVAHQLGKKHILSETFACTGWNISFAELKWMYEWQMVRGVTLLCQHLQGYSLRGIRKRDYPPSLFIQQPWWDRYRFFNDAVSRVGLLLAEGQARFETLVLHPQSSAWLDFDNGTNRGIRERFEAFLALSKELEGAHIPFDYGDERILQRHAWAAAGRLRVGHCAYRVVLVPPVSTLAAATADLLCAFARSGGTVIWCGSPPTLIAGEECGAAAGLADCGRVVATPAAAVAAMPNELRRIRVRGPGGDEVSALTVTERWLPAEVAGEPLRLVYVVNSDREASFPVEISVPGAAACRLVMETGRREPVAFQAGAGRVVIPYAFAPCASLILFVSDRPGAFRSARHVPAGLAPRALSPEELAGPWEIELLGPNALTLDTCDVTFDGELIARNDHISIVQQRALDLERPVTIALRFTVDTVPGFCPPADCCLVMEQPQRFAVTVNGRRLAGKDMGSYVDSSFRRIDLEGALREGHNEIVATTRFTQPAEVYENLRRARVFEAEKNKLTYDSEIEACYLAGSFGVVAEGVFEPLPRSAQRVAGPFRLGPLPRTASPADLTVQGLPFFAGTVRLRKRVELTAEAAVGRALVCRRVHGHVLRARVNGRQVAEWFWPPYVADLATGLRPGANVIELELTGGLRNLLGPHHLREGESYGVGPGSFFKEPNIWGNPPWDERTCLVRFGLEL